MKRLKSILERVFILPLVPTLLISSVSFSLLYYVFASHTEESILAYIAYFLSAYGLSICVGFIVCKARKLKKNRLMTAIIDHPFSRRMNEDRYFRERVSLHIGSAVNIVFALTKLVFGIVYRSEWFIFVAVYYLLLAFMRIYIIRHIKKSDGKTNLLAEYRIYRFCAFVLLILTQVLTAMVVLMVFKDKGYEYTSYLIYVMAGYCFYMVISAAVNLYKFRKIGSPLIVCIKVISLTVALVSVLSLETAMLTQFGDGDVLLRQIIVGSTGAFVCLTVLIFASYMLIKAQKRLKA